MFKRFSNNLSIKLFCLFAAVFLWVYVAAGQSTVGRFPNSLKIKSINAAAGLVAIYDIKTVEVKIMAEPSVWKQLSTESFSAYVDLSGLSSGTHEVPVNVVSSVPGVQIVEKSPDRILISLEQIITKEVNINKRVEGSAADGLVAGTIELTPNKVQARGAKSVIDNLTEASIVISLNGETENFKKTVGVTALDENGEIINNIEFLPAEVTANVAIVKASNNKTVGVKVKTSGSPKTGYFVSAISASPSVIDVTGPRTALAELNYVETFAIDITNISTVLERDINLNLLNGIALQAGSPEKIRVKITLLPLEISKELYLPVDFANLDPSYRVANASPSQVKVIVTGPSDTINNLNSSDLGLSLDLKGKLVGIFSFDVNNDNLKLPDGVVATSILPSAIAVTIEKK